MTINKELHALDTRITKLETHYDHFVKSVEEIKKTQEELKGLINQGKGAYRLLIFLAACIGGVLSTVANAFMGK